MNKYQAKLLKNETDVDPDSKVAFIAAFAAFVLILLFI
jgi:hypothetical protein